uniref:Trehalose-6-phosphate synthase n=1 Tax=Daucus carota subsp. sativus TaxID=79200 RepID=A0A175YEV9_DAUCS
MNFANLAFRDLNRTNPCIKYVDSDGTSSTTFKIIIVSNMLPLHAHKDGEKKGLSFNYDEDSPLWQRKDGFSPDTVVFYVVSLNADIDVNKQEEVVERLMDDFNRVHTFLVNELFSEFYHGFCKHHLWPIFHYMLPMCGKHVDQFDLGLWQAYISANKIFADKVLEVANPETDYIWIHDYHLMAVLVFLRNKRYMAKLGFFLQSPVLASEIYRTLPVRADILRIFLNYDLIGFHTFDFARHILSCCSRMLGLDYESKRGQIGLDYSGRTVYIKIPSIGIHLGKVENVLNIPSTSVKVKEFKGKFKGKHVIVGVDDMNLFQAIILKLLAFEQLLRQGSSTVDEDRGIMSYFPRTSVLIIYEYVGCSPSLSGAIRINSWDISSIAEAMRSAVSMDDSLRQLRHEQNYSDVQSHDVTYWARSFLHSMERACLDHYNYQCWVLGFSFTFKVDALSLGFQKLFSKSIVPAYNRTDRWAIFLDFDGTLVPHSSTKKNLSSEVVTALNTLCDDPKNTVFIVSGRGRNSLTEWMAPCEGLGLAAEHGYFIRYFPSQTS